MKQRSLVLIISAVSCTGTLIAFGWGITNTYNQKLDNLTAMVVASAQAEHALQQKLDQLLASQATPVMATDEVAIDTLTSELLVARTLAGLTDVQGAGVVVTLDDSRNGSVIHDSDLLMLINELRDAGAQALSINGERLLATSEVRCAGSILSVNNQRLAAPFEIAAVGSTDTLYNALHMKGGVLDVLTDWELTVLVEKREQLTISAFAGNPTALFTSKP